MAELYIAAARAMNSYSCKASAPSTPHKLFTKSSPEIPQFKFGEVGLVLVRRTDNNDVRSEYGMFLTHGDTNKSCRVYLPTKGVIVTRRKFVPVASYPACWNLRVRTPSAGAKPMVTNEPPPSLPIANEPLNMIPSTITQGVLPEVNPLDEFHVDDIANEPNLQHQEGGEIHPSSNSNEGLNREGETTIPRVVNQPAPMNAVPPAAATVPVPVSAPVTPTVIIEQRAPATLLPARKKKATVQTEKQLAKDVTKAPHYEPRQTRAMSKARKSPHDAETSSNMHEMRRQIRDDDEEAEVHYAVPLRDIIQVYRLTLRAALKMKDRQSEIIKAINEEIRNILGVAKPIRKKDIPKYAELIPAHMFLKLKYKANGDFDKVKARLVANGNLQDDEMIQETFAPTVNPISVFTQINIAAHRSWKVSAYDIKKAFLLAPMPEDRCIVIMLGPLEAELWVEENPEQRKFLDEEGKLFLLMLAFLYGLQEAPHQFNKHLDKILRILGLTPTQADPCVYTKGDDIIVSVHVDDLLVTTKNERIRHWFEREMGKHFELVTQRDNVSYLGMNIIVDYDNKIIKCTQEGYCKDLLKKFECANLTKFPKTPYTSRLFQEPANEVADSKTRKYFLSVIMSLMFIARYTRPDILLPTTVLATRSSCPTVDDIVDALRIAKYLGNNPASGLTFDGNIDLVPEVSADASHATYYNGYGQGGIIMTLGSAPVFSRSFKLKSITRSSTESELYALEEATTYAIWWKNLLTELRVITKERPIVVYQDNLSTIILGTNGGSFKRTKHLIIRESFVREKIQKKQITVRLRI
jgi:hypothetical protein